MEEIGAWSDATRSFETFFIIVETPLFYPLHSFVSNELAFNNRNQIGDEHLHFLVYREVEKVLRLCLFAPLAGYGARFETPENREYKREIGWKCVSLHLRINRLKKKKKTTSSV